jgi:hypothetical protein
MGRGGRVFIPAAYVVALAATLRTYVTITIIIERSRRRFPITGTPLGISQHPIHRRDADIQPFRDLGPLQALARQPKYFSGLSSCRGRASFVFAVGLGLGYTLALPLQQQPTLEFSDGAEHSDHQLAGRAPGVDPLATHAEHDQTDAAPVEVFQDAQ